MYYTRPRVLLLPVESAAFVGTSLRGRKKNIVFFFSLHVTDRATVPNRSDTAAAFCLSLTNVCVCV